jgi:hypothetical protein
MRILFCILLATNLVSAQVVIPFLLSSAAGTPPAGAPNFVKADSNTTVEYVDSVQLSFTTTGTNDYIISVSGYEPNAITLSAKVDWVSATEIGHYKKVTDETGANIACFIKTSVAAGTHTLTAYGTVASYLAIGVSAYSGGTHTTSNWTTAEGHGTTPSVTLAGETGKLILGFCYTLNDNTTTIRVTGTGHTRRFTVNAARTIQSDLPESSSNPGYISTGSGDHWVVGAFKYY